jgi:hypothetical protein
VLFTSMQMWRMKFIGRTNSVLGIMNIIFLFLLLVSYFVLFNS